ncbi:MAG: hypothetical protein AAF268_10095 [Cyanobacteria bacterium P01_A01_bin.3]
MQSIGIIGVSIIVAIAYGAIHDQITARICIEYFTIGHSPLINSNSPTVVGLVWGIVATWWVGLLLGTGLAIAARFGKRPKLTISQLLRSIGYLLCGMLGVAILAGAVGFVLASTGAVFLLEPIASQIPPQKHVAYLVNLWAHTASYLSGLAGGLRLWIVTWRRRGKLYARAH